MKITMQNKLIVVFGPTSSGKTELARRIAKFIWGRLQIQCEFINADSRKIYQGMNIGTHGVDKSLMKKFPYHLTEILSPNKKLDAEQYKKLASKAIQEILTRKHLPILEGGTGTYILSIVGDQFLLHPSKKPSGKKYNALFFIPSFTRKIIYRKIEKDVDAMFEKGLYNEVRALIDKFQGRTDMLEGVIGYRQFVEYANKSNAILTSLSKKDLKRINWMIKRDTKKYAMHQIAWLKKLKDYTVVHDFDRIKDMLIRFVEA